MNATLPTGRQGGLLALALLVVALAAAYLAVAAPLLDIYSDQAARAASERLLLAKLSGVAAELPALKARIAALRAGTGSRKLTFEGSSDAVATAALQGGVERLAAAAGVTVGSTEILAARPLGDYHRIGLRVFVSGSYASLVQLLATIDSATPPLVVDNMHIRTLQPAAGGAPALDLEASLEVSGFRVGARREAATQ